MSSGRTLSGVSRSTGFHAEVRTLLRDRLLDAAGELTIDRGWGQVRMSDIAERVGVSRQTVYNEFGAKPALAEAMVMREAEQFFAGVHEQLAAHRDDLTGAVTAAVEFMLDKAAANPLLKAVLTASRGGADELLPFITRSEQILGAAVALLHEDVAAFWPGLPLAADELPIALDSLVRLAVSHLVMPLASSTEIARQVGWLIERVVSGGEAQEAEAQEADATR